MSTQQRRRIGTQHTSPSTSMSRVESGGLIVQIEIKARGSFNPSPIVVSQMILVSHADYRTYTRHSKYLGFGLALEFHEDDNNNKKTSTKIPKGARAIPFSPSDPSYKPASR